MILLKRFWHLFSFLFLWAIAFQSYAQMSSYYVANELHFREALDLYDKEKYGPAMYQFEQAIEAIDDIYSEVRIDAEYYHALCAVELFHLNADALLKDFIEDHPESAKVPSAYYQLANYKFRKRRYSETIQYLTKVDPFDLNESEKAEYHFKLGYSYFQEEEFDKAANSFYKLVDTDNKYSAAARYYYAHISYQDKKYETAAVNFRKIADHPQFGPIVPYYLTQIYYLQGKYDELLAYAPAVLDSASSKREDEINRLIGDALYQTGNYEEALPYLEKSFKGNHAVPTSYKYQMGYAYFKSGDCEKAIDWLQKSILDNDSISQAAYYNIGECNIRLDNKMAARTAFRNAYKLNIDPEITEDALFNYAKTAYELSYHPYDDAILAFEEYINTYPNSSKINDANEYLVGVYYTTKNYKEALRSLERIKNRSYKLEEARQRLAYFRGIELFNKGNYTEAMEMFQLSLQIKLIPQITAPTYFWLAESEFRTKDFPSAINYFEKFLAAPGAMSLPYYKMGYYNTAYSYYEQKKYTSAIFWFREYVDKNRNQQTVLVNDALLRIGDSYFIGRNYRQAVEFYDKAAQMGMLDKDYAIYQSAVANGVLGNYTQKAALLKQISDKGKGDLVYRDDAIFELGKTYLVLNNPKKALEYYNQLLEEYPNSSYLAETNLKIGLIHYNQKEDNLALKYFDNVVKNFSGSSHSKEALDKIRKIYIDKGDLNAFEKYVSGVPFADISKNEMDSTAYIIAENYYLNGNCDEATQNFTTYLNKYPQGIFTINAHFYRAECENKSGFNEEAIRDYEFVLDKSHNKFTENALAKVAEIYRSQKKNKEAIAAYSRLESVAERKSNRLLAKKELMKLNFKEANYDKALSYAQNLLSEEKLDEKEVQFAKLIIAKSYLGKENFKQAVIELKKLVGNSNIVGAEAKYLLAHTYYLQGKLPASDSLIFELVDQVPTYPYWVAKGFILLADNYVARGDFYNAKVTFESVINNADDPELVQIAEEKYQMVLKAEADANKAKDEQPLEIELENVGNGESDEPNTMEE